MAATDISAGASVGISVGATFPPQGVTTYADAIQHGQTTGIDITALTFGTGSGQCDLITCSDRTLAISTAATYDLYTGTDLKDLIGGTCAFRKVKWIMVSITADGDSSGVRIGGAASNAWVSFFADTSDMCKIFPGGPPYFAGSPAGVAVGATTCNLKVENLSGAISVAVRITICGTSV